MQTRLARAMTAVLDSLRPHGPAPTSAEVDLVARVVPGRLEGLPDTARACEGTALVVSLARSGRTEAAIATAESLLRDVNVQSVTVEAWVWMLVAAAEAYATAGEVRDGARVAREALSYAELDNTPAPVFRARAFIALSCALNGEYAEASSEASRCRALQREHAWPTGSFAFPLLLAEVMVASAALDRARLVALADEFADAAAGQALWIATAHTVAGMVGLIDSDVETTIAELAPVLSGTSAPGLLEMIRGFAVGIQADVLLARGEPRRALSLLADETSPASHVLCFAMQRSSAHLLLGDDRRAVIETDACLALGSRHCLRTWTPVLLRRAIALDRLGHLAQADEQFGEAMHLIGSSRSMTPFLTLPTVPLRALLERFARTRPEHPVIATVQAALDRVPAVDVERPALPKLTDREARLAGHLRGTAPIADIAAALHVSPNTVKTQLRSLYRKLGVRAREDAVAVLQERGFFH